MPQPLTGSRVRLWAESESGRTWTKHLDEDLWLVPQNAAGHRHYWADRIAVYEEELTSSGKERTWRERTVRVRNETKLPLQVRARAWTTPAGGKPGWAEATFTLDPGKAAPLQRPDGWALRGSKLEVTATDAKGERFRWVRSGTDAWVLADKDGYRGKDIGTAMVALLGPRADARPTANPPAGLDRPQLLLALPPTHARVPALKGETLAAARGKLKDLGFEPKPDDGPARARILSQLPAAGWHRIGATVQLSVEAAVPDVTGLALAKAQAKLKEAGFEPEPARGGDPAAPVDGQEPDGGYAPPGSKVRLTLQVKVPAVKGEPLDEARTMLAKHGFKPRFDRSPGKADHVYAQAPAGGKWVSPRHAEVVLTPGITVPALKNEDLARAVARLKELGIAYKELPTKKQETEREELARQTRVTYQSAVGRQPLDVVVRLEATTYVVKGPPPPVKVRVPRFVNMELQDAQRKAKEVGLVLKTTGIEDHVPTTDRAKAGRTFVSLQTVPEGREVDRGSEVRIVITTYRASNPPSPPDLVTLPDLINRPVSAEFLEASQVDIGGVVVRLKRGSTITTRLTRDPKLVYQRVFDTQDPPYAKGKRVPRGTVVTVTVARYLPDKPPPPAKVRVPGFVNKDLQDALRKAKELGLVLKQAGVEDVPTEDKSKIGHTIVGSQSIPEGREVDRGTEIRIVVTVYRTPKPPPPNIIDTWIDDQRQLITFNVNGTFQAHLNMNGKPRARKVEGKYVLSGNRITLQTDKTVRGTVTLDGRDKLILSVGPFNKAVLTRFGGF